MARRISWNTNAPDPAELSARTGRAALDCEATAAKQLLARRLREARLAHPAVVADSSNRAHRGLDLRALSAKLSTSMDPASITTWVMIGPTGIGSPWLACALGPNAARGPLVLYKRSSRLFRYLPMRAARVRLAAADDRAEASG